MVEIKRNLRLNTFLAFGFVVLVLPGIAPAGDRLYYEDFEDGDYQDGFRGPVQWQALATTTNHPRGGSRCLRGNFFTARNDPITGLPGHTNPLLECDFGGVSSLTPDTLYVRLWARLDNANWAGVDAQGVPITGLRGKTAYLTEDLDGIHSMFHSAGNSGSPTNHTLAAMNGSRMSTGWASENWGSITLYGSHSPATFSPDGQWHKLEYLADYVNDELRMWFDGEVVSFPPFPDGKVPIPSDWHMRGLQIWYVKADRIQDSTDGPAGEYACGWQLDDIEAWNGWPGDSDPPGGDDEAPGTPGRPYLID